VVTAARKPNREEVYTCSCDAGGPSNSGQVSLVAPCDDSLGCTGAFLDLHHVLWVLSDLWYHIGYGKRMNRLVSGEDWSPVYGGWM
jgi:hypothetical protein